MDDESAVREVAKVALELAGYRVLTAVDGVDAVEVFCKAKDRIRLVVLDASMPRMSGRQAFEAMLAESNRTSRCCSRVAITAAGCSDSAPNTRLLNKPYIPSQLSSIKREMLAGEVTTCRTGIALREEVCFFCSSCSHFAE